MKRKKPKMSKLDRRGLTVSRKVLETVVKMSELLGTGPFGLGGEEGREDTLVVGWNAYGVRHSFFLTFQFVEGEIRTREQVAPTLSEEQRAELSDKVKACFDYIAMKEMGV